MYIARIHYPILVLGPGRRVGIWVAGCNHKCKGCCAPELWKQHPRYYLTKEQFRSAIDKLSQTIAIDGFTLSGGDPFYDLEGLNELLDVIIDYSEDVLVYTGYNYQDLWDMGDLAHNALSKIAVLIDGAYDQNLNHNEILRGSSNQNIIFLKENFRSLYNDYLTTTTKVFQNFKTKSGFVTIGIPNNQT